MKDRASTGALLSCLLPLAMAAAFGLARQGSAPRHLQLAAPATAVATSREPVWARCLVDLPEALRQPGREFRSSLPFRGLATAAFARPSVVLATYEFEHNQDGPELENLTLALNALDRLVLPPGAELSFNRIVGPRLQSRGFQPGLMYSQGKVITGVGGGVCVASTALYDCALEAGLPIIERWMHSGPTSYAAPTRDAAVVFGTKDLRVKNNTSSAIWVVTRVENGKARVSLLSLRPVRYRVALREVGEAYIPFPLQMEPTQEPEVTVIQKGAPGCDLKLVREFLVGEKVRRAEMICRDVRKPVKRILGIPSPHPDSPELGIPGALPAPALEPLQAPDDPLKQPSSPDPLPVPAIASPQAQSGR